MLTACALHGRKWEVHTYGYRIWTSFRGDRRITPPLVGGCLARPGRDHLRRVGVRLAGDHARGIGPVFWRVRHRRWCPGAVFRFSLAWRTRLGSPAGRHRRYWRGSRRILLARNYRAGIGVRHRVLGDSDWRTGDLRRHSFAPGDQQRVGAGFVGGALSYFRHSACCATRRWRTGARLANWPLCRHLWHRLAGLCLEAARVARAYAESVRRSADTAGLEALVQGPRWRACQRSPSPGPAPPNTCSYATTSFST